MLLRRVLTDGIHQRAEIRSGQKGKNSKPGVIRVAAIIEGKNYELIRRNESGDRSGDKLRSVDGGRHGPGLANVAAVRKAV